MLKATQSLMKVFILLILLVLLGCERTPLTRNSSPAATDPLNGTGWILLALYGHPPLEETKITLEFSGGYVGGNSGCNDFGGERLSEQYQISSDGSLTIPSFAATMVLCSSKIMDQEEVYVKALHNVVEYRLMKDQLELKNGADDIILVFKKWH